MNTPAKPTSIASPNYFWNALEQSQIFELFNVFGSRNNFRFAIHKKTGRNGMIWFEPYEGEWDERHGLMLKLVLTKEWPEEFKVPRQAREALENYPPEATQAESPNIEKIFLPEEVRWGIEQMDATLSGNPDSKDISEDADLVQRYLHGDGRYMKLKGSAEEESSTEPLSFEQLEAANKEQSEFAAKIFALWHGPVSKLERARFASLGRDGELTLNLVDACSPHLERMRKETSLVIKQVELGKTSYEQAMFGPDGFKARLEQVVGYGALHPALALRTRLRLGDGLFPEKNGLLTRGQSAKLS